MDRRKKFRKTHKTFRNDCRKRNYKKKSPSVRRNRPWTNDEVMFIVHDLNSIWGDAAMAVFIGRSVQAIQQKRYLLKKEKING